MSRSAAPGLGRGLYFLDVLACLLFGLTLALVGARFDRERTVDVDLPELERAGDRGSDRVRTTISLRGRGADLEIRLEGEPVSFAELRSRLAAEAPPVVVVRAESSGLARVVATAHEAGVREIQLAYQPHRKEGP
ncbi:MAG: biopolymer transporter ExbD [Myxococcota bacterium]